MSKFSMDTSTDKYQNLLHSFEVNLAFIHPVKPQDHVTACKIGIAMHFIEQIKALEKILSRHRHLSCMSLTEAHSSNSTKWNVNKEEHTLTVNQKMLFINTTATFPE